MVLHWATLIDNLGQMPKGYGLVSLLEYDSSYVDDIIDICTCERRNGPQEHQWELGNVKLRCMHVSNERPVFANEKRRRSNMYFLDRSGLTTVLTYIGSNIY